MRRTLMVLAAALLLTAAASSPSGGWAVVTVEDLPEHLVEGEATTLSFTVRQHGVEPTHALETTVALRQAGSGLFARLFRDQDVEVTKGGKAGLYHATLTPTAAGDATVVIGFPMFRSEIALLPLPVVTAGERPPEITARERGRQLFVAKGCASCHGKREEPAFAERMSVPMGPDLTGRSFDAGLLARKLADPSVYRVRAGSDGFRSEMPDLGLDEPEIAALVRYLEGGRAAATGGSGGL